MHGLSWDEKECVSALCVRSVKRREICRERERGEALFHGQEWMRCLWIFIFTPRRYPTACVSVPCVCVWRQDASKSRTAFPIDARSVFSTVGARARLILRGKIQNIQSTRLKPNPKKTSASTYILYSGLFRHPSWPSREDNQVFW
jgi:hypothetical protein